MARHVLALMMLVSFAGTAPAASWADALFDNLSHDFGTVPRGPIVTHYFHVTNTTGQPLHIVSVRVSCGCLRASATRSQLAPGESTTIVAELHTDRFAGFWRKPFYVTFDQPQWAEVTIMVQANSRDDVTLAPDTLAFGRVRHGTTPDASVTVVLSGGGNWKVLEAKSDSDFVQPRVRQVRRDAAEAAYQVTAQLRPDLPVGNWYSTLKVATDNPAMPQLTIPLTVEVGAPLSVSPKLTTLGQVKQGTETERKILVRADQPFRILEVKGTDSQVRVVDSTQGSAPVHRLVLTFRPTAPGALSRTIQVITDLQNDNRADFQATADVVR
jgi:hypothetical protein